MAGQVKSLVYTYLREGWHTFFFDGSAKRYEKSGYVGGYDCCFPGNWEFTAPLEEDEHQTNNRAKLKAAIVAVLKVTQHTVIFRDSKFVLDQVQGDAYKWRRWCASKGPIPNSMLCYCR